MSKIVVRHAEARDAESLRQFYAQPEVYHNLLQLPHPPAELWEDRLKPQPGRRQLVACIDEQVAGNLTLMVEQNPRRSHVAIFGMAVSSAFQNRGVASALIREMINLCDNWLRIERIELTVFVDNAPALAVYRKFGFEIEGTAKRYALRNGEFVDSYFMARMKG
ncbi:N-acetyltransferase [Kosakonia sp. R1.Fl]|uniref:N-acetyltransferase n=1 Tax=Kosakonia sp. R1.Fl TaxID=2928706 RepID=UPI00201E5C9C|nr:N-acetyltransferase [Kosakonia sp. R1.Fl]MCL6742947.1 N-acetyltransferase [Kosakonia sp. R1.Fl]